MTAALLPLTALCALLALWYAQDLLAALRMPRLSAGARLADGPLVSVIVPARDEAARIGACLEGLARQSYRRFEVIVLDDNSSDETAAVARGYAARLPALEVRSGAPLPAGWAGKCWACWQAAGHARGEWLLFLDADVAPRPDLIAALVAHGAAAHLDMITLVPRLFLSSLAERLVLPSFILLISSIYPFDRVNDPRSPLAFAIGQCIMVRRSIYRMLDGHRAVRASVVEDMELAQRVKDAGARLGAFVAPDLIEVRMYSGWATLAEGLTKNAAAGYRMGGVRSGLMGLRQGLMAALPLNMLLAGALLPAGRPLLLAGALLLLAAGLCWGLAARHRFRISPLWGALTPLGTAIYFALATRAVLQLRAGKGVVWKGRVFTR